MKKTVVNILIIAGLVAGTWFAKGYVDPNVINKTQTDTVYVDKPYKVVEVKEVEKPVTVTKYKTKYDTVKEVQVVRDTVYVNTKTTPLIRYHASFLSSYPSAPKFLGLIHQNQNVELTYFTINGHTQSKTWNTGGFEYQIGLNQGEPSLKTTSVKKPDIDLSHNVNAGVIKGIRYWSPYAEYNLELKFFEFPIEATANINRHPFVSVGVGYEF